MSPLVMPDVAGSYQAAPTLSYPRDGLIHKASQGGYFTDPHISVAMAVCTELFARGSFASLLPYHVVTSEAAGRQFDHFMASIGGRVLPCMGGAMLDAETWRGTSYELRGDHSALINDVAGRIRGEFGAEHAVALYGNQYDLAELASHRDGRMPVVVAAYTSTLVYKNVAGGIAQQYTDGESKWAVPTIGGQQLPRATAGFGACDHNVFPAYPSAFALRRYMRPLAPEQEDFIVALTAAQQADFNKLMDGYFASALQKGNERRLAVLHLASFAGFNTDEHGQHHSLAAHMRRITGGKWVPFLGQGGKPQPIHPATRAAAGALGIDLANFDPAVALAGAEPSGDEVAAAHAVLTSHAHAEAHRAAGEPPEALRTMGAGTADGEPRPGPGAAQ